MEGTVTTLDRFRIQLEQPLDRGWRARLRDGGEAIAVRRSNLTPSAGLEHMLRYEVPGIARLEFLGYADGDVPPTARQIQDNRVPELWLVEARPPGARISDLPPLDTPTTVRLGIDLCTTTLAWAERCELLTPGIRPETVYLDDGRFTGATPRIEVFLGRDSEHFSAPADSGLAYTVADVGFLVARVLWFAHLRVDPYRFPGALDEVANIWENKRRAWTGEPALGAILERVLVVDGRLSVAAFRDALEQI